MFVKKYSLRALRDIARISNDGMLAYNVDKGIIEFCNKALSRILGKPLLKSKKKVSKGCAKC
jgi:PAS domain-containing protein